MSETEALPIKQWIKKAPSILFDHINQGSTKQADYFCTFVQKQGRMLSLMSNPRILILVLWKNRTYSLGYIEMAKSLPPWNSLPYLKYEKQLALITNMQRDDNVVEFMFKDEEAPWKIEFKNSNVAAKWRTLVKKYRDHGLSIRTQQFQINNLDRHNQKQRQCKMKESSIVLYPAQHRKMDNQGVVSFHCLKSQEISQMPTEERTAYIQSQTLKIQDERNNYKKKQEKMKKEIKALKQTVQKLQKYKQEQSKQFKALNQKVSNLMLEKIVNDKIKEQYLRRYQQISIDWALQKRDNAEIKHLCSKLYEQRIRDKQQIKRLKQQINLKEQMMPDQISDSQSFIDLFYRMYNIAPNLNDNQRQ